MRVATWVCRYDGRHVWPGKRRSGGRKAAPTGPARASKERTLAAAPCGAWLVRYFENSTGRSPCWLVCGKRTMLHAWFKLFRGRVGPGVCARSPLTPGALRPGNACSVMACPHAGKKEPYQVAYSGRHGGSASAACMRGEPDGGT